jgi:hypothetical protein
MNRSRIAFLSLVILALVAGLVLIICLDNQNQPLPSLKVTRHAVEQGKEVFFFKVTGAGDRRIHITRVERVTKYKVDGPLEPPPLDQRAKEFWSAESLPQRPIGDPNKGRYEFGVFAPTAVPTWKLRVAVDMEAENPMERFKSRAAVWRFELKAGKSLWVAARDAWSLFLYGNSATIESDVITNGVLAGFSFEAKR